MDPRRRTWVLLAAGVGAAGIAVVLLGVYVLVPPGYTTVGIHRYAYESEELFGDTGSWQNYSYRGVTFEFHLWCEVSPGGGTLCGHATEADGTSYAYSFSDGPPVSGEPPWQTWVAPDSHEAVQYQQGGHAHLLVAA